MRERFGLEPREIAVMAASHFGEPFHVEAVESILKKIGLDESALQCGIHPPIRRSRRPANSFAPAASSRPLFNNCSGKHAGILALCTAIGCDTATYLEREQSGAASHPRVLRASSPTTMPQRGRSA